MINNHAILGSYDDAAEAFMREVARVSRQINQCKNDLGITWDDGRKE